MSTSTPTQVNLLSISNIEAARIRLKNVATKTPLMKSYNISEQYQADIWLKREDLQKVRSYKLRGAYNKISTLSEEERQRGVICASAGNHAQGVAYSCNVLKIKGLIFMPITTPNQKIKQVELFGKSFVEVRLVGDTFDDSYAEAQIECEKNNSVFVHPFDDERVMEGQGTVSLEILEDSESMIDYLFLPIGGGGLIAGAVSVFKQMFPSTKIIGVQPAGAPSMYQSFQKGHPVTLSTIDKFVDGASVKRSGEKTFAVCHGNVDDIVLVPEGKICTTMLKLYNEEGIVVEPAGALSIAALDFYRHQIKGKSVVCVVSGGNNDITRMEEIKERSLLYEGLKHYFMVRFPQRAGALKEFLSKVLGPNDDITYFQYTKKNNRENGPAIVGIELKNSKDLEALTQKMRDYQVTFEYLNNNADWLTNML